MGNWEIRRFVKKRVGRVWWELVPEMEEVLYPLLEEIGRPASGHEWKIFQEDPRGNTILTIKTNRPGLPAELIVKVFKRKGIRRLLGAGKRSSNALREWNMAVEHVRRGLPVAARLARGVKRSGPLVTEEYIVQESLTSYESFDEFFRTTFRPELPGAIPHDKRRVIRELSSLVRRMHDRGVSRRRIEPHNIMAAPRSGGGVNFVFRDLALSSLRKAGKGFPVNDRILELARFDKSFSPLLSQSYRLRFYREYFSVDDLPPARFHQMVKNIMALSITLASGEEPEVMSAVWRREPPYFWFKSGPTRVYMRKPLYQNSLLEAVEKIEGAGDRSRVRIRLVGKTSPLELLAVKISPNQLLPRGVASAAQWAFLSSAIMEHHGISHFRVMASVEKYNSRGGWALLTAPGKGEYNLAEYLARKVADDFSGLSWDRKFLIRLARYYLGLCDAGWHFPRPGGDDIWVRLTEEGTHEIRIFNLHNLRRLGRDGGGQELKSLFDLWCVLPISQADGLMLAEEYIRFCGRLSGEKKRWVRKFMEWQMEYVSQGGEG